MQYEKVEQIINEAGGVLNEVGVLPDGSGFATASFPLREDHWIYGDPNCERELCGKCGEPACEHAEAIRFKSEAPPMPFRVGNAERVLVFATDQSATPALMSRAEFAAKITAAIRYAVRAATMNGKEMDFDPDALVQNAIVGLIGYWTDSGLSGDKWCNPQPSDQKP